MSLVHVLPSDVIARIAAGEVVERPASVVKELVENSLDAGAMRVEAHLKDGGKTLIHIKDNGRGITVEDMAMLFQRHATSKIASADDLESVLSLGFRGEALYSIGSVAEVKVLSRAQGEEDAWDMDVVGGKKEAPGPAAMAHHGTDIRVKELFFNTPARRKFLKSDTAEVEQALNVFMPYALLYPERHFTFTHNGRTLLEVASTRSHCERMAQALNLPAEHLIETEPVASGDGISLRMVLGDINIQRPRRDLQFLFVNGRPVLSRAILFHVNNVYRLIMAENVHPAFAIFLEVPPAEVDVNIHPAKREVRIRQEGRLGGFLRAQVEQALMSRSGARQVHAPEPLFTFPERTALPEGLPADKVIFAPGQRSASPELGTPRCPSGGQRSALPERVEAPAPSGPVPPQPSAGEMPVFSQFAEQVAQQKEGALKDRLLRARFLGTFANKYHLFEEAESLFVIDQHAAQERVLFEKFCAQVNAGKVEVQRLLTPLVLALSPQEMLCFEQARERLNQLGFEADEAGLGSIAVQTVPALFKAPEQAVRALLSDEKVSHADTDTLARRACRASVMAGDRMAPVEAVGQLKNLLSCAAPFTCPHGRPVFVELRASFLDRQFMRT